MKTIEIQIDDELFQQAQIVAESRHSTVQDILVEMLKSLASKGTAETAVPTEAEMEDDPILRLIGSIHLEGVHDLGENHDYYIGQALYREMHPDE